MEQITIEVSRNLSKVDEMRMEGKEYTLRAEIESAGGAVKNIGNGAITDSGTGEYLGSFNAQGARNLNVSLQGIGSRDVRMAIYDTVEDFVEGVTGKVAADATTVDRES